LCAWRNEKSYRIVVVKPQMKKLIGRPNHRWEDNIKKGGIGCVKVDWIEVAEGRVQL
jgi:hypothetical protein